jgi:hypothetical protein
MSLILDPEFESLMPSGTDEENLLLESELLRDGGPTYPLLVWKDHDILVDGHRRYRICVKHNLEFSVEEESFEDRDAVRLWILMHQLSRRSISTFDRAYYTKKLCEVLKKKAPDATNVPDEAGRIMGRHRSLVFKDLDYTDKLATLLPAWQVEARAGFMSYECVKRMAKFDHAKQEGLLEEYNQLDMERVKRAAWLTKRCSRWHYLNLKKKVPDLTKELKVETVMNVDILELREFDPLVSPPLRAKRVSAQLEYIHDAKMQTQALRNTLYKMTDHNVMSTDTARKKFMDNISNIMRLLDWLESDIHDGKARD